MDAHLPDIFPVLCTMIDQDFYSEWNNGLTADLDVTSDHDGSGYTLVLSFDQALTSLDQWAGTASSSDQKTWTIESNYGVSSGGTFSVRLLLWFSTSPNLIAAYLDGTDVCQGGSTETTDTTIEMPDEPQGPAGAVFKYDLLSNSDPGISYPDTHIGAFVAQNWPSGLVNEEDQEYTEDAATQDGDTGEITIKAEKSSDGTITSARLESYQVWSTAQSEDIKMRGYVEVRSTMPVKVDGDNLEGSWPAIWMLGTGNGQDWPTHGEIDIVEAVNGDPEIYMTIHSTNYYGANGQHPDTSSYSANSDFTQYPLIAGFEWNIKPEDGQIDLTWWFTWYDISTQNWESNNTTKVLYEDGDNDYDVFYDSFNGEGFSLLINLAEGGVWPNTDNLFVDGQPQYMQVSSVKVYGF